jgi:hypothetical protein
METNLESISEVFWPNVARLGECWVWRRGKVNGYGQLSIPGDRRHREYAHRIGYMLQVGPIPDGMTIDHLCHNRHPTCTGGPTCFHRACVRGDHLEPVPLPVNIKRRPRAMKLEVAVPRCRNGHLIAEVGLYLPPGGTSPQCRGCRREAWARSDSRRRTG